MPPWAVSAIFTNISTAWERSFRSYETVQKADASVLLQDVNEILRGAKDVLEGHKAVLTPEEYSTLQAQHRTYQWMWFDEHRHYLNIKDDTAKRRRAPSKLEADKEACETRATNLLETVKTYSNTILEASRKASANPRPAFPDEEHYPMDSHTLAGTQANPPTTQAIDLPAQAAPTPSGVPTLPQTAASSSISRLASPPRISGVHILPTTTEILPDVGLMGRLMKHDVFGSQIGAQTAERSTERVFVEGQGFGFAVAHVAQDPGSGADATQPSTATSAIYQRMISVKLGDEQMEIRDKKALAAALPVIQRWLRSLE
ncbi:hypothetical protein FRC10_004499 [Ceratobasidium sp. 414]|nr:hypothetical protein FRC10_004499 [Ceratobasidium sp. 414]